MIVIMVMTLNSMVKKIMGTDSLTMLKQEKQNMVSILWDVIRP